MARPFLVEIGERNAASRDHEVVHGMFRVWVSRVADPVRSETGDHVRHTIALGHTAHGFFDGMLGRRGAGRAAVTHVPGTHHRVTMARGGGAGGRGGRAWGTE